MASAGAGTNAFERALLAYSEDQMEDMVRDFIDHSIAASTHAAYDRHWNDFQKFASKFGIDPFAASPNQVARFLALKANVANSPGVADLATSAIKERYTRVGIPSPTDEDRIHKELRGIHKKLGKPVKQAPPMTPEAMGKIIQTHLCTVPQRRKADTLRAWRTVVRMRMCFGTALRANEMFNIKRKDITFPKDKQGNEYLRINVPKSKTDQEKKGSVRTIPPSEDKAVCAVKMMKRYLACLSTDPETPLQQKIQICDGGDDAYFHGENINMNTAADDRRWILKGAGFPENVFTEHSGRRGAAVAMKEAGCTPMDIQTIGNWKSISMPLYYSRGATNANLRVAKNIM